MIQSRYNWHVQYFPKGGENDYLVIYHHTMTPRMENHSESKEATNAKIWYKTWSHISMNWIMHLSELFAKISRTLSCSIQETAKRTQPKQTKTPSPISPVCTSQNMLSRILTHFASVNTNGCGLLWNHTRWKIALTIALWISQHLPFHSPTATTQAFGSSDATAWRKPRNFRGAAPLASARCEVGSASCAKRWVKSCTAWKVEGHPKWIWLAHNLNDMTES